MPLMHASFVIIQNFGRYLCSNTLTWFLKNFFFFFFPVRSVSVKHDCFVISYDEREKVMTEFSGLFPGFSRVSESSSIFQSI